MCLFFISIAFTALDDHQSGYECYRKALELDPDNQSYQNNLEIAEQKLKEQATQVKTEGSLGHEKETTFFRVIFGVLFHYYLIILYLLATSFGSQSLAYSIDTSLLII